MCEDAVEKEVHMFQYVPYQFKTREMCEEAVKHGCTWMIQYVPDLFMTKHMCEEVCDRERLVCLDIFQMSIKREKCVIDLSKNTPIY